MDYNFKVSREMLIFAFRYSLGRMSYASDIVVDNIKKNINTISTNDIELYIKEINECKDYGMQMDEQSWMNFKKYLEKELEERENNKVLVFFNEDKIKEKYNNKKVDVSSILPCLKRKWDIKRINNKQGLDSDCSLHCVNYNLCFDIFQDDECAKIKDI